ncbi:unnamed protein product, partial [Rotaria sp. Silwood2]
RSTTKGSLPERKTLCSFPRYPLKSHLCLQYTMKRIDNKIENSSTKNNLSGAIYILSLEFLGDLISLLTAKRISKICPDFITYDSQIKTNDLSSSLSKINSSNPNSIYVYATETDVNSDNDDLTLIKSNSNYNTEYNSAEEDNHNLNVLQEKKTIKNKYTNKLCTIAANIWGPRFKFYSHSNSLRETLYSFTYQTSFLHLQPR